MDFSKKMKDNVFFDLFKTKRHFNKLKMKDIVLYTRRNRNVIMALKFTDQSLF